MSKRAEYERFSREYDNHMAAVGTDVMCALMQFYTSKPSLKTMHVLDAGCGTANYAKDFIRYGVGHVTLLDAASGMLEVAKRKLATHIEDGTVVEILHHTMPPIPFSDASFDAVVFSLVLNHLDKVGEDDFPACVQTLKEATRVLRPGGVIFISTILKSNAQNMWSTHIDKSLGDTFIQGLPSLIQFEEIFYKAGIFCIQKMNILGSEAFSNYFSDPEAFAKNYLHYLNASDDGCKRVLQVIRDLKRNGLLENWIKEHDKVNTMGLLTLLVCKAKPCK